jgi:hypothetical protein
MGVRLPDKLEPSENDLTAENLVPREMGPRRAVFLLMASLLLWCGSMLLVLDLATNASGNQGQVALVGLFLVAIGGSCLWADFFEVTTWFAREASQRFDDFNPVEVVVERLKNHRTSRDGLHAGAFVDQENRQAGDADEGHVQEELP